VTVPEQEKKTNPRLISRLEMQALKRDLGTIASHENNLSGNLTIRLNWLLPAHCHVHITLAAPRYEITMAL
jgi:hypothetical protein